MQFVGLDCVYPIFITFYYMINVKYLDILHSFVTLTFAKLYVCIIGLEIIQKLLLHNCGSMSPEYSPSFGGTAWYINI